MEIGLNDGDGLKSKMSSVGQNISWHPFVLTEKYHEKLQTSLPSMKRLKILSKKYSNTSVAH